MSLMSTVQEYFEADEWPVEIEDRFVFTAFEGDAGVFRCFAIVEEEAQRFLFYSVCPVKPQADAQVVAFMEAVVRANDGLAIGNFELDTDTLEVRFKTSIDVEGDRLSPALVRQLVISNVLAMDRYLPAFEAVAQGADARDAIALVEAAVG